MSNINTGNNATDKYLVDRVLSGDNIAFASIIKNTEGLVAQIVFKMVKNPDYRKDIAQDIYLKIFRNLAGFKFQSKLSTWIAQVSYNTCLDHLRKKKMTFPGSLDEENEKNEPVSDDTNLLIRQRELSGILKAGIEQLPPVYKTLITLYHNEELSYEEIVQITGLPEGTVKSYLFRARKALKNSLLLNYKKEDI
ncbi:MAG: RNA polymerase sigma factor [Chitinophagaceae bacterium]